MFFYKYSDDDYEPDSKRSKSNEHVDLSNIRSKLQKTKSAKTKVEHKSNVPENEYEDTSKENDEEFDAHKRKREEIKREIMELQREMKGIKNKKAKENQIDQKESELKAEEVDEKNDMLVSFHQEQKKYASKKVPSKGKSREDQTMALLAKFKAKLGKYHLKYRFKRRKH